MSDDIEQGAKVDAHAGAVRARETGHGSGMLRSAPVSMYTTPTGLFMFVDAYGQTWELRPTFLRDMPLEIISVARP